MHFLLYNNNVGIPVSNLKRIHVENGRNTVETVQGNEYVVSETAEQILKRVQRRSDLGKVFTRIWQPGHGPNGEEE